MSGRRRDDDRTVYSSERGRVAPKKQKTSGAHSPPPPSGLPNDGIARVRRETAGRHGKTVTAVHGLRLAEGALRELASELKRLCGTGGSAKDSVIEIQGEHVDKVLAALEERGIRAKRGGG
jgi:translation initiation factor 1